jgi:hypothetical protein
MERSCLGLHFGQSGSVRAGALAVIESAAGAGFHVWTVRVSSGGRAAPPVSRAFQLLYKSVDKRKNLPRQWSEIEEISSHQLILVRSQNNSRAQVKVHFLRDFSDLIIFCSLKILAHLVSNIMRIRRDIRIWSSFKIFANYVIFFVKLQQSKITSWTWTWVRKMIKSIVNICNILYSSYWRSPTIFFSCHHDADCSVLGTFKWYFTY